MYSGDCSNDCSAPAEDSYFADVEHSRAAAPGAAEAGRDADSARRQKQAARAGWPRPGLAVRIGVFRALLLFSTSNSSLLEDTTKVVPSRLHLLLLRIGSLIRDRRGQALQRLKILQNVMILEDRQILQHGLVIVGGQGLVYRTAAIPNPKGHKQQERRSESDARRNVQPRPPAGLGRGLRGDERVHARIEFRRGLDQRKLVQKSADGGKFLHAQTAGRAVREVLFQLGPLVCFQPPVHVSEDAAFHSLTTHNWPTFLALSA